MALNILWQTLWLRDIFIMTEEMKDMGKDKDMLNYTIGDYINKAMHGKIEIDYSMNSSN